MVSLRLLEGKAKFGFQKLKITTASDIGSVSMGGQAFLREEVRSDWAVEFRF